MSSNLQFFAPCPRGLEPILQQELTKLEAKSLHLADGGVHFQGDWKCCAKINLHSRIASRILWRITSARYRSEQDIYRLANSVAWSSLFRVECTIKINVSAIRCPLIKSLDFITLKIKDAICDRFRNECGIRPSVNTHTPDLRIHAFLEEEQCTLYIDTSGEALFKRGWRQAIGDAPLRENLATGLLYLSGWQVGMPLFDPMCGSGTFLIEAAEISLNRAAGIRRDFALSHLQVFDASILAQLRHEALAAALPTAELALFGNDLDPNAIDACYANIEAANLGDSIAMAEGDCLDCKAPAEQGILLTNPPYGVRIGEAEELDALYPTLGNWLKKEFAGWNAYFFTADRQLEKGMRLKASKRTPLFNGALDCRLFEYKIIQGSMRS